MAPKSIFGFGGTPNVIFRQLAPITNAAAKLKSSLYSPPQETIDTIVDGLWPNPLQPITPIRPPGAEPLSWPFNWGQNIMYTPRQDAEYSAEELRRLSKYPLARICIENNKDLLTRMPWKIQLKPLPGETSKARASKSKNDPKLKQLNDFFARPNWEQDWPEFIRPVLEDMLVIDAASIFVGRDIKTNKVTELRWVEGASITRLIDQHGWTPKPPNPAYQQNWEGYPRIDLTTDQLVYRPRNICPRGTYSSYFYGMSPTEQIAKEILIGMERLQYTWDFYSEGSVPNAMLFAPINTPPDKIKEAQQIIDAALAGKLGPRRRLQVMQGFQEEGKAEQLHFPKEPSMADTFDDLHIRKVCFAYGTSPQRLQRQMNRAAAEQAQESAEEEGTLPWLKWMKGTVDYIIQVIMQEPDYEFAFEPFVETNRLKQMQADEIAVRYGIYSINEIREQHGDDPRPEAEADDIGTMTPNGFLPITERIKPTTGGGFGSVAKTANPNGRLIPFAELESIPHCSNHVYSFHGCPECDFLRD